LTKNTIEENNVVVLKNKKKMIADIAFGEEQVTEIMSYANNVKLLFSLSEDPSLDFNIKKQKHFE
jgi:hypothetical protein